MATRKKRRTRPKRYLLMPLEAYRARVAEAALAGQKPYFHRLLTQAQHALRLALPPRKSGSKAHVEPFELGKGVQLIVEWEDTRWRERGHTQHVSTEGIYRGLARFARSEESQLRLLDRFEYRRRALLRRSIYEKWWLPAGSAAPAPP